MRLRTIIAGLGVAALVLAACAGDDGSDGDAASDGATGAAAPTGAPVKIGLVTTVQSASAVSQAEIPTAIEAAVDAVNEDGGIKGRPLELVICDDHFTADASAACFRQLTDDKDVMAIFGTNVFKDASADVLNQSGVATIGSGASKFDYTDDQSILLAGGAIVEFRGAGVAAGRGGLSVSVIRLNLPQADAVTDALVEGVKSVDGSIKEIVPIDPATADMSAPVAAALRGNPGAVILFLPQAQIGNGIKALRQAGYEGRIVTGASQMPPEAVTALGSTADGLVGVTLTAPPMAPDATSPSLDRFRKQFAAVDSRAKQTGPAYIQWLAVNFFAEVANGLATIDRQSVVKGARAVTEFDGDGAFPAVDFSKPGPFPGLPNVVTHHVAVIHAEDGVWAWDGKFIDIASAS